MTSSLSELSSADGPVEERNRGDKSAYIRRSGSHRIVLQRESMWRSTKTVRTLPLKTSPVHSSQILQGLNVETLLEMRINIFRHRNETFDVWFVSSDLTAAVVD